MESTIKSLIAENFVVAFPRKRPSADGGRCVVGMRKKFHETAIRLAQCINDAYQQVDRVRS